MGFNRTLPEVRAQYMQNYRIVCGFTEYALLHNTHVTVCDIDGMRLLCSVYAAELGLIYAKFGNTSEAMMSRTVKVEVEGK